MSSAQGAKVSSLEADLSSTKSQLTEATSTVESNKTEMDGMRTEIADLQQKIADLSTNPNPGPETTPGDDPKVAELEALVEQLQAELGAKKEEVAVLNKQNEDRMKQRMKEGLEGRVLAVNPAWNFVVISIGDKSGVVNNSELLLKRGNQLLGKVRVTAVEPSTSIADIVANSMPAGVSVQPGDSVIYQSSTN